MQIMYLIPQKCQMARMSYSNLLGNDTAFRGCVCEYWLSLMKFNCMEETGKMVGKYMPEMYVGPYQSEKKPLTAFAKTPR